MELITNIPMFYTDTIKTFGKVAKAEFSEMLRYHFADNWDVTDISQLIFPISDNGSKCSAASLDVDWAGQ